MDAITQRLLIWLSKALQLRITWIEILTGETKQLYLVMWNSIKGALVWTIWQQRSLKLFQDKSSDIIPLFKQLLNPIIS